MLDVAERGTHDAIGSRAFSDPARRVAAMGRAVAEGLLAGGVAPVIKHMPGHGRARVDSHYELPVVDAARSDLQARLRAVCALSDLPMAMSAHVVFTAIDPRPPGDDVADRGREIMRGDIGFDGLIMSDDLSMKALNGPFDERAAASSRRGSMSSSIATAISRRLAPWRPLRRSLPASRCVEPMPRSQRSPRLERSMRSGPSGSWPRSRQNWASPERAAGLAAPRRAARVRFCTRRWPTFVYLRAAFSVGPVRGPWTIAHLPLIEREGSQCFPTRNSACFAIADISGYTHFVSGVELDHAQDIIADIMDTLVKALRPPFRLAKFEGDAAFVYALERKVDGSLLQDSIEQAYFAFRRRLRNIKEANNCECQACSRMQSLDVKFVVHHGEFIRQKMSGREELAGREVILVHRLLKNDVAKTFGAHAYALYSDACIRAMGIDPVGAGSRRDRRGD